MSQMFLVQHQMFLEEMICEFCVWMCTCMGAYSIVLFNHNQPWMKQDPCSVDLRSYFCMRFRCIALCNIVSYCAAKNDESWIAEAKHCVKYCHNFFFKYKLAFFSTEMLEHNVRVYRSIYFISQVCNIVECNWFLTYVYDSHAETKFHYNV